VRHHGGPDVGLEMIEPAPEPAPAFVLCPGRLARWRATVARRLLIEGVAAARRGAARPGSPQEGPARLRRDRHESGGAARGRSLWTHRGERLGGAITPRQADRGERSLMHLKLHANATTTPRTRAISSKAAPPTPRWPASSGSTAAPWRAGKAAKMSPTVLPARSGWPPR
jgi:hypothetical protein